MPEKHLNEVSRHGHDVVAHELHMKQHLIDGNLIKLTLRHDQKGNRKAQKEKNDEGADKAERKRPGSRHGNIQCLN